MRTVVVGASSGLGRCIGVGLTQRGAHTVLMARRVERLEAAAKEAGPGTLAVACDVTSAESCRAAIDAAVAHLGGIDALVYTPAIGPLASLVDTDADTWRQRVRHQRHRRRADDDGGHRPPDGDRRASPSTSPR